jgi:hypothetical protein
MQLTWRTIFCMASCLMCRMKSSTSDSWPYGITKYQVSYKYSYSSWWWTWKGPKHVEVINKIDEIYWEYCATSCFHLLQDHIEMHVQQSIKFLKLHWTTNFKKIFVSVMNMLLIYLFASMKLEKGHEKDYLAIVLKLCYHYDILRNRLKYVLYGTVD